MNSPVEVDFSALSAKYATECTKLKTAPQTTGANVPPYQLDDNERALLAQVDVELPFSEIKGICQDSLARPDRCLDDSSRPIFQSGSSIRNAASVNTVCAALNVVDFCLQLHVRMLVQDNAEALITTQQTWNGNPARCRALAEFIIHKVRSSFSLLR